MPDLYDNMTVLAGMTHRKFRAHIIRDFLKGVLAKTLEYHKTKDAQDTMQDVEEMLYDLWKIAGARHGRKDNG